MGLGGLGDLGYGHGKGWGKVREWPGAAGTIAVVEIPAAAALGAAAVGAGAEIEGVGCAKAELATAVDGARASDASPPAVLHRKHGNALFEAEMAAAVLEVPAGFVADLHGAAGALKDQGSPAEAAAAEIALGAAAVREPEGDGGGSQGEEGREPGGEVAPEEEFDGKDGQQNGDGEEDGGEPERAVREPDIEPEPHCPGAEQRSGEERDGRPEERGDELQGGDENEHACDPHCTLQMSVHHVSEGFESCGDVPAGTRPGRSCRSCRSAHPSCRGVLFATASLCPTLSRERNGSSW